ncbi:hypothetical protein [Haladaptatus sp. CMAA 1911]|uniref:hypothetical protein n=1 Tax=unclassified Haladaptatus TaxID=2622732 RepID=UPI0037553926
MTGSSPSVPCAIASERRVPVETHGNRTGRTNRNNRNNRNDRTDRPGRYGRNGRREP